MASETKSNKSILETVVCQNGMDLFGIAGIADEKRNFHQLTETLLQRLSYAVVIGKRLSPTVLYSLEDGPNLVYFHHYRQVNFLLDRAAHNLAEEIEKLGYEALAIPASQIVDWQKQLGHVSHKKLAEMAGLGWLGRNNLLVNERLGARTRLASVLTNLPLEFTATEGIKGCGSCRGCLDACPAGAIKEKVADFDHLLCFKQLNEFRKTKNIGQHICGLCVKACSGFKGNGGS